MVAGRVGLAFPESVVTGRVGLTFPILIWRICIALALIEQRRCILIWGIPEVNCLGNSRRSGQDQYQGKRAAEQNQ
jgi:hypothetical protein